MKENKTKGRLSMFDAWRPFESRGECARALKLAIKHHGKPSIQRVAESVCYNFVTMLDRISLVTK